ncbi:MAG: FkbM family methyltransferase [bacterium]
MNTGKLGKYEVMFDDSVEYHALKREIWGEHCYYLELGNEAPHILDIGSHIGLSILYFKQLFPGSTIDAYEPHQESLKLLKENLLWNNIQGVNLHESAVVTEGSKILLHTNTDDSWRSTVSVYPGAWNESQVTRPGDFAATPLRQILTTHYDLIKMDVEGYEYDLISSVKHQLSQADRWLIEIHGRGHYDIREMLDLFEKAGFVVRLEKGGKTIKPHQLTGLALLHAVRGGLK